MKFANYFQNGARDGGSQFVKMTDDAPEWLVTAVHEAHGSDLPNDWIYAECQAIAYAIDDGSVQSEDDLHMHADGRVEVYTQPLFQWMADMCHSDTYALAQDEVADSGDPSPDMVKQASAIQYYAVRRIATVIWEAYEANNVVESE